MNSDSVLIALFPSSRKRPRTSRLELQRQGITVVPKLEALACCWARFLELAWNSGAYSANAKKTMS
eukprot:5507169-Lingulodinium_polyedra.AAC.1